MKIRRYHHLETELGKAEKNYQKFLEKYGRIDLFNFAKESENNLSGENSYDPELEKAFVNFIHQRFLPILSACETAYEKLAKVNNTLDVINKFDLKSAV